MSFAYKLAGVDTPYKIRKQDPNKKAADRKATAKYRATHQTEIRISQMRRNMRRTYGLSLEDFWWMNAQQGGKCKICRQTCSRSRALSVDHCHATGRVRGLLCGKCNLILGKMSDSPVLLRSMAEYLEENQGVSL